MSEHDHVQHVGALEILLAALSLYVIVAITIETVFPLNAETTAVLRDVDTGICVVFIAEFLWRLAVSKDRLAFLKWGWIDLVSSIPLVQCFRWGRLIRVVRVFRILRGVRSARLLTKLLFQRRAKGALASVVFISILLVVLSAVAILNLETGDERNIRHAGDALWWAVSTVTTVGYGDRYPVTAAGRIVGVVLMVVGVGLFGTFTAYVASIMLGSDHQNESKTLDDLHFELSEVRAETLLLRTEMARISAALEIRDNATTKELRVDASRPARQK